MRVYVSIFCFYILALAFMPCTDANTCDTDFHSETTQTEHHNHNEDHNDSCSPFCVCACCGSVVGFVLTSNKVAFNATEKINNPALISNYDSIFNSAYFYSFWQPPKI